MINLVGPMRLEWRWAQPTLPPDLNVPPTNTVPGPQNAIVGTPLVMAGFSVADPDSDPIGAQLVVTSGTLALAASGGQIAGNNTSEVTVSGTPAQVNQSLASVTFNAAVPGPVTLTMTSGDFSGATDVDTVAITVAAANQPPLNTVPAPTSTPADTPVGLIFGVTDPDSPAITSILQVMGSVAGTLQVGAGGVVTDNDTSMVTVRGTPAQVNTSLGLTIFFPASGFAGVATIQLTSGDGQGGSDTDSVQITVTAP